MVRMTVLVVAVWCVLGVAVGRVSVFGQGGGAAGGAEGVAAMKERLAVLRAEVAALEGKIAAAEAPAAGSQPGIVAALNAMPKNLWPGESDTTMKETLRDKWLEENMKAGASQTVTGLVFLVSPATINVPGKKAVEGVHVVLDCGTHVIWGKETSVRVVADVENVSPAETLDWGEKKNITITGVSRTYRFGQNPVEMSLEVSKVK